MAKEPIKVTELPPEKLGQFQIKREPEKIIHAFSVRRVEGGWQLLELLLNEQFDILEVKESQPDVKAIITEMFRIRVGRHWNGL